MSAIIQQKSQAANALRTSQLMIMSFEVDPTIAPGVAAIKGTLGLQRTAGLGAAAVWIKNSDTLDTDWLPVSGSPAVLYPSDAPFQMPLVPITIPFSGSSVFNIIYMEAQGGGLIDATIVPVQIAAGTIDGQVLWLRGTTPGAGNGVLLGGGNLDLNGNCLIDNGQCLFLSWDDAAAVWRETSRRQ